MQLVAQDQLVDCIVFGHKDVQMQRRQCLGFCLLRMLNALAALSLAHGLADRGQVTQIRHPAFALALWLTGRIANGQYPRP
ncbi:hypothetical protein D3C79_1086710 [compost metagenome]